MPEDDMMGFLAMSALAEHSSLGHGHLLNSAYHFLLTRLAHEQLHAGILTRTRIDELTEEAWVIFVQGTLATYKTWLAEVDAAPTPDHFDLILNQSRSDFEEIIDELATELAQYGIL